MNTLPNELLYTILNLLDAPTQSSFCEVFPSFKNTKIVAKGDNLNLDLNDEIKFLSIRYNSTVKNIAPMYRLERVDISFTKINIETQMLYLEYLNISNNPGFNVDNLKKCPNLRHLICSNNDTISNESVSHLKLTTLLSANCPKLTFEIVNGEKKEKVPAPQPTWDEINNHFCEHFGFDVVM
jgi:hypothetical protein